MDFSFKVQDGTGSGSDLTGSKKVISVLAIVIIVIGVAITWYYLAYSANEQPFTTPKPSGSSFPQGSFASPSSGTQQPTPVPTINPALSIMEGEVRDLILSETSKISSESSEYRGITFIRGKILIWDLATDKQSNITQYLPAQTLAQSPNEKITILSVVDQRDTPNPDKVYISALYWPEKISGGYQAIEIDYSRDNATERVPAEWIMGLPHSNGLPVVTLVNEIQDIVLAGNQSYYSSYYDPAPTVSGKVFVWDFEENEEVTRVESILPARDLVADHTEGEITVFAVVKKTNDVVGYYTPGGGSAVQVHWDVLVLHYPEKVIVGRQDVVGRYPPSMISGYSYTGDIYRPMAEWILSLNNGSSPGLSPTPSPSASPSPTIMSTPTPTSTPLPTASPTPSALNVALDDAVAQDLVQISVTGRNLEEINLAVNSLSQNTLQVTVEPGTIFKPGSSYVQSMMTLDSEVLTLTPFGSVSRIVSVACTNMTRDVPDGEDAFTIQTVLPAEDLLKLINSASFQSETFRIKQFAIWTITDNSTRSGFTAIGYSGNYTKPNETEIIKIKAIFEQAGVTLANYRLFQSMQTTTPDASKQTPVFALTANGTSLKIGAGDTISLTGVLSLPNISGFKVYTEWSVDDSGFIFHNGPFETQESVFSDNFGYPPNFPQPQLNIAGTWQIRLIYQGDTTFNPSISNSIAIIVSP